MMAADTRPFSSGIRRAAKAVVIDLHGEIDARADATINTAYAEAVAAEPEAVLLNFGDVDYINSTGIALIVGLLSQARAAGMQLLAFGLSDHYQELFRITRLSDYVGMFHDEASALADTVTQRP
jgi:anti-anti-sigma factor